MDSKEFGLVAAQQLFQVEDLHYGFWKDGEKKALATWKKAQESHTDFLFNYINKLNLNKDSSKLLDVGCGVGITTKKLLDIGYKADGLVPYEWMAEYARNLIKKNQSSCKGSIYECTFERFPIKELTEKYKMVFTKEKNEQN